MQALLRLTLAELRTASDDVTTVVNPHLEQRLQTQSVRPAIHQSHVVNGKGAFQRCVAVELCEHSGRVKARLHANHHLQTIGTIGKVDSVRNTVELLLLHALTDTLQHLFRADHIRKFGDNNALLARCHVFHVGASAGHKGAPSSLIGLTNTRLAHNHTTAWKVRTRNEAHQLIKRGIGVEHHMLGSSHHLTQIVRDHIRGHTHGNTLRTVDQKVRNSRRQHIWLAQLVVVVRGEGHGSLMNISIHGQRRRR